MWRLDSGRQAALWWIAVWLMVVDHVGALFFPDVLAWRVGGRLVLPIFAVLIAYNMHARGVPAKQYVSRLVPFALIAQIPYWLAFGPIGLNILFTLLLGVVATRSVPALIVALAAGYLFPLEYGIAGVALVPLFLLWLRADRWVRVSLFALLGLVVAALNPSHVLLSLAGVSSLALLAFSHLLPELRRAPRWFGYGFYPAHLAVLVAVGWIV